MDWHIPISILVLVLVLIVLPTNHFTEVMNVHEHCLGGLGAIFSCIGLLAVSTVHKRVM